MISINKTILILLLFLTVNHYSQGYAVQFDGTNDYADIDDGITQSLTGSFTIETWVNLSSVSNWMRIFDFGSGTTAYMFLTPRASNGYVRFAITTNGGANEQQINTTTTFPLNEWVHVAVTYNQLTTTGTLYVNGQVAGTNASMTIKPSDLGLTTQNYLAKSQYADPYLNGKLDEFRIWSEALSQTTIQRWINEYVDTRHQNYDKLFIYLKMDEGSGNTLNCTVSNYKADLINSPLFVLSDYDFLQNTWSNSITENNTIQQNIGNIFPIVETVKDGKGGAFLIWKDMQNGFYRLKAQRINVNGVQLWGKDGIIIDNNLGGSDTQFYVTQSENSHFIVGYTKNVVSTNFFVQKIDSNGVLKWGNGIIQLERLKNTGDITTDGSGGVITVWDWQFTQNDDDILYYHLLSNGQKNPRYSSYYSELASDNTLIQNYPQVVYMGNDRIAITWLDRRPNNLSNAIYYQMVDFVYRTLYFGTGGRVIVDSEFNPEGQLGDLEHKIAYHNGNLYITWTNYLNGISNTDIGFRRIGLLNNTSSTRVFIDEENNQFSPQLIVSGSQVFVVWQDCRNDLAGGDIYLQRFDLNGQIVGSNILICDAIGEQSFPKISEDGNGGVFVAWQDRRNGQNDIYMQHINSIGTASWDVNGIVVSGNVSNQYSPSLVLSTNGTSIIAWGDDRNSQYGIYASKVFNNGALPVELSAFNASIIENGVQLNWQTATEVNNYGFEIQRTVVSDQISDVIPVLPQGEDRNLNNWEKVGFVEGHGNSNSPKQYSFTDEPTESGTYSYRLKQIDFDGKFEYSEILTVEMLRATSLPTEFALEQNYPNPFNPTTSIEYSVPSSDYVSLKVYDILGNEVAQLVNEKKEAGRYRVNFNASSLSSGVYFYSINAGEFNQVRKMMLVK